MIKINLDIPQKVFFMGIGGISMSGLAQILHSRGFDVSGSDIRESKLIDHLKSMGINVAIPQSADNISDDIDLIVYTAAIHPDNPEYKRAIELSIPLVKRSDLLGNIMDHYSKSVAISGTHGKTTTTSMLSHIFLKGNEEPTISVGGNLRLIDSNVHIGDSQVFITEACEYTNSFHSFYPRYSIILNIEADHLDFFKDIDDIRNSFKIFASNTKPGGDLIISNEISSPEYIYNGLDINVYTFGLTDDCDCYAKNISYSHGYAHFDVFFRGTFFGNINLHIPGEHNIKNALAAICTAILMGVPYHQIYDGLDSFGGADRRFQHKGYLGDTEIIDDYAHHPSEIISTIKAARNYNNGHITIVFQPHTYTRTKALFNEFVNALSQADTIVLAPIYAARETDDLGVSSELLVDSLKNNGKDAYYFSSFDEIESFLEKNCTHSGLLITMGAGNIYVIGEALSSK